MISHRFSHRRSGYTRVLAILLSLFPAAASGQEPDRFYVTPDGRKFGLTKSETEYGMTLRQAREAGALAKRLELTSQGTLEALPGSAGKFQLLRVARTSVSGRESLRKDPSVADIRPVYRFQGIDAPVISTGEIMIRVRADLSEARRQQLWTDYHIQTVTAFDGMPDVYTLGPFPLDVDELLVAEALANDPRTVWAQPNFRRDSRSAQVVSDLLYGHQWHLHNENDTDLDAPEAWAITQGEGIIFGMRDDSCDVDHPDLAANYLGVGQDVTVLVNTPGFDDPRPKIFDDRHGTAVMGLAAARANTIGGRGVAPLAKFAPTRGPFGFGVTDREIAGSYIFALGHDADVHINSWGYNGDFPPPQILVDAIQKVFTEGRRRADVNGDGEMDPLGMVVLFASGNDNRPLFEGLAINGLPEVISVGASDENDRRALFSNFGDLVDILAPGVNTFTTDNTDTSADTGYNTGGFDGIGQPEVEPSGNYTGSFTGTSAACPVAAGVAGLVLAANPRLTASDVRLILEHTAEKVWPEEANYHPVTGRSYLYGYGRINAHQAVLAAKDTLANGGFTWPDPPANVFVFRGFSGFGSGIFFSQNYGTSDVLVVESGGPFEFVPQDGLCYDERQPGCAAPSPLPGGVQVRTAGCGFNCYSSAPGTCAFGVDNCIFFELGEAPRYFALYSRNTEGRYSWGVSVTSGDFVLNAGRLTGTGLTGGGDNIPLNPGRPPAPQPGPAINVNVTPLRGPSPLTVNFRGNATSPHGIDESKTAWDFDIDDDVEVDARTRQASHVYTADDVSKTYVARFSMTDAKGNESSQEVAIFVEANVDNGEEPVGAGSLRIVVGLPGTPGSNVSVGKAPFSVLLSVDATQLPGSLQSVAWDLGDGFRASTLTAAHTYFNDGTEDLRLPITATVTSITSTAIPITTSATRMITIQPGPRQQDIEEPRLPGTGAEGPGGSAAPCGAMGMIPLAFCLLGLLGFRRWRD